LKSFEGLTLLNEHDLLVDPMAMDSTEELLNKLKLELRRGVLILAVLSQLRREHFGYSLRKVLAESGLEIDEGTLYPLIRRLENQGLLTSEWRVESNRKKRFYRLSSDGRKALKQLSKEYSQLNDSLQQILG